LGKIRLVMRSPEDEEISDFEGLGMSELFAFDELRDRGAESVYVDPDSEQTDATGKPNLLELLQNKSTEDASQQPALELNRHQVRIMRGDKHSIVEFAEPKETQGTSASAGGWNFSIPRLIFGSGGANSAGQTPEDQTPPDEVECPGVDDTQPPVPQGQPLTEEPEETEAYG
jgi:hypothetical protein